MKGQNGYVNKELRHVILKLIILKRIKMNRGGLYSYAIIKRLSIFDSSGFCVTDPSEVKNDVYNTIASLEKSGYIRMVRKGRGGRPKKYYFITALGVSALKSARKDMMGAISAIKETLG